MSELNFSGSVWLLFYFVHRFAVFGSIIDELLPPAESSYCFEFANVAAPHHLFQIRVEVECKLDEFTTRSISLHVVFLHFPCIINAFDLRDVCLLRIFLLGFFWFDDLFIVFHCAWVRQVWEIRRCFALEILHHHCSFNDVSPVDVVLTSAGIKFFSRLPQLSQVVHIRLYFRFKLASLHFVCFFLCCTRLPAGLACELFLILPFLVSDWYMW